MTMLFNNSPPNIVSHISSQIQIISSNGDAIQRICLKMLYKYFSSQNLPADVCPDLSLFEVLKMQDIKLFSPSAEPNLEDQIASKILPLYERMSKVSAFASFQLNCSIQHAGNTTTCFDVGIEHTPMHAVKSHLFGLKDLSAIPVDAALAVADTKGVLPKLAIIEKINSDMNSFDEAEMGFITNYVVFELIKLKKSALSPEELVFAFDLAKEVGSELSTGLCVGYADLFGAFCLEHPMDPSHLFDAFKASRLFKQAPLLQKLYNLGIHGVVEFKDDHFIKRDFKLSDWRKLRSQISSFYDDNLPQLFRYPEFEQSVRPLFQQVSDLVSNVKQRFLEVGVKDVDISSEAGLKKAKIFLSTGGVSAGAGGAGAGAGGNVSKDFLSSIINDLGQKSQIEAKIINYERMSLKKAVVDIHNTLQDISHFSVLACFGVEEQAIGHAISMYFNKDTNSFVYFDSNHGCFVFDSSKTLLEFFLLANKRHKSFELSYSWPRFSV